MSRPFRYVETTSDTSVNLHLFTTLNGSARANVRGPISRHVDGRSNICEQEVCIPDDDAFALGIRMANRNDTDLVISSDQQLWDDRWGRLSVIK